MLSQPSQLLQRNIELFSEGQWLLVNPADAQICTELAQYPMTVMHQYFDVFTQAVRVIRHVELDSRDLVSDPQGFVVEQQVSKHRHWFRPFAPQQAQFTDVLIYMPKAKQQLTLLLAMLHATLLPSGRIHLVGENKGGIKSAAKILERYGSVHKVDSARHCSLLTCHVTKQAEPFDPIQFCQTFEYDVHGKQYSVFSLPGVFSHGELDAGTRLLLEKLPHQMGGNVLDFACGAGVIGSYLLHQMPALAMSMLDVSALALYCSAHTLTDNQQQAKLLAADGIAHIPHKYQHIVTNPPFHTGVKTDYSTTQDFIAEAPKHLHRGGTLHVVANRFLAYPSLLEAAFTQSHTIAQNTQFSVYHATR